MRREKSSHRSDSFQTRPQFARESSNTSNISSYAAALAGHQAQQVTIQPSYQGYPQLPQQSYVGYTYQPQYQPPTYSYPLPPPPPVPMSQQSRESTLKDPSHQESQLSFPAIARNEAPGFQPNPFAKEFVPTGGSGSGSGISQRPVSTQKSSSASTPPTLTPSVTSRNSTPPTQVKKTASFENTSSSSRPLTPTPVYARSQSASSMRPQEQYPAYITTLPALAPPLLPFPPPFLSTARQAEWGPPITTGTVRYVANGQSSNLFQIPRNLVNV